MSHPEAPKAKLLRHLFRKGRGVIVVGLATFMAACGGGSPSAGSATSSATSLDNLVVAPDFTLQATYALSVEVQLDPRQRAYFSLCNDFKSESEGYWVNFESCLIRAALGDGQLHETLQVANHNRELLAVVWYYDGSEPYFQRWQSSPARQQQALTIIQ